MKKHIVLISGKQGSGKSTLTQELLNHYGRKENWLALELRFANAIYDIHDKAIEIMRSYKIDMPKKDGDLLQLLGTEWGRKKYGDDVWVKIVQNYAADFMRMEKNNVFLAISDCRFTNEFNGFPQALRVRLECDPEVRRTRAESWRENSNHPSEVNLDDYASDGLFDLYLDTSKVNPAGCASLVIAQLDKNVWLEKRDLKFSADQS